MTKHISVLLNESISGLNIKKNGIYVDMTLGYAGHSKEILKKIPNGYLYAFDKDIDACNYSNSLLSEIGSNYKIFNTANYNIKTCLEQENILKVDGILFDLGVSSVELDEADRGFSYMHDAFLDMRMDQNAKLSAYDVINSYSEEKLIKIFREYGEEKNASRVAKNIIQKRSIKPIGTTKELATIIDEAIPFRDKRNGGHPAKKVFQAIRIEVNNELNELRQALKDALDILNVDGYICVISFHSLEDRICKNIFKEVSEVDSLIKGLPNIDKNLLPNYEIITKKPILPSEYELKNNSRSKSAKLRIIKRIK